jgi:hypothetical protein
MRGFEPLIPVVIIVGVLSLIGVVVYLSHRAQKRRTAALSALAENMGLPFFPAGDPGLLLELARFHLFSQGRAKRIRNMLHGDAGDVRVAIFDYQYTVGSGKHSHTHVQTVASFRVPELRLPEFALRPENLFHKIGGVFGYLDIDFESHPAFSRAYLLRGSNEPLIRRLFVPEVLVYFESHNDLCVEGSGPQFVYYRNGRRLDPDAIRAWLETGFELLRLFRISPATGPAATGETR